MEPRDSAPGTGPPSRLLAIHACEVGQGRRFGPGRLTLTRLNISSNYISNYINDCKRCFRGNAGARFQRIAAGRGTGRGRETPASAASRAPRYGVMGRARAGTPTSGFARALLRARDRARAETPTSAVLRALRYGATYGASRR